MAAGLASGLALGGCAGDITFNYRLSVSVRVGDQTVIGSNVRRLRWDQGIKQLGFMDVSRWKTQGEATLIDLGARGLLIATLAQKLFSAETGSWYVGSGTWTPVPAFARAFGPEPSRWPQRRTTPVALLPSELPLLVTFHDPANPRSVAEVAPDSLSKNFGAGVTLESIVVEITRDAATQDLRRRLPWISDLKARTLGGGAAKGHSTALYDNLYVEHLRVGV